MSYELQPQNHGEDYVLEVKFSDGKWRRIEYSDKLEALEQLEVEHEHGYVARVYVRTWRLL